MMNHSGIQLALDECALIIIPFSHVWLYIYKIFMYVLIELTIIIIVYRNLDLILLIPSNVL